MQAKYRLLLRSDNVTLQKRNKKSVKKGRKGKGVISLRKKDTTYKNIKHPIIARLRRYVSKREVGISEKQR